MTETAQLEMEAIPDSDLGKACKRYIAVKEKIKDMDQEGKDIGGEILNLLGKDGRSSIRFGGWEFESDVPAIKLLCHPVKGKSEADRKN